MYVKKSYVQNLLTFMYSSVTKAIHSTFRLIIVVELAKTMICLCDWQTHRSDSKMLLLKANVVQLMCAG